MGLLNKFKSMMDSGGGGGKLDVDARYEMLRKSISGTCLLYTSDAADE